MTTIAAEGYEIAVQDGVWALIPDESVAHLPVFEARRGAGVIKYRAGFGAAHRLPGTVLSVDYVQAVILGYEMREQCWLLGLHIAAHGEEKARWIELVRWPPGENMRDAAAAQQAGRALAEHIGCPLQIFGAKKLARPVAGSGGATGPLVPHRREDVGPERVKLAARNIRLPLDGPTAWLGQAHDQLLLRQSKPSASERRKGRIAPAFNQAIFDTRANEVRLVPATGLLGTLFGGQRARTIPLAEVRNIELRQSVLEEGTQRELDDGVVVDVTLTTTLWEIYLTLRDESVLLAQAAHMTTSDLSRQHVPSSDKFHVDLRAGIEYLRQHEADQAAYDRARNWAEAAATVIASALNVSLVKTEVVPA